jgi:hypothetical protein
MEKKSMFGVLQIAAILLLSESDGIVVTWTAALWQ